MCDKKAQEHNDASQMQRMALAERYISAGRPQMFQFSRNPALYAYRAACSGYIHCLRHIASRWSLPKFAVDDKFCASIGVERNVCSEKFVDLLCDAACSEGHLPVAQWLVATWDNINLSNESLYRACAAGRKDIVLWIAETFPAIDLTAEQNYTFRCACTFGHLNIARWIVQQCPNVNQYAVDYCALRMACRKGHEQVVRWLISRTDTERVPRWYLCEALHAAFIGRHEKIARRLLNAFPTIYVFHRGRYIMGDSYSYHPLANDTNNSARGNPYAILYNEYERDSSLMSWIKSKFPAAYYNVVKN